MRLDVPGNFFPEGAWTVFGVEKMLNEACFHILLGKRAPAARQFPFEGACGMQENT